jgi:alanine or glycine:cation symporter, AGCS family
MSILLDQLLFYSAVIILLVSIVLSIKTQFVQIRLLPEMVRKLFSFFRIGKSKAQSSHTIEAHKALFTAMSTTIGLSTIVGPVIAMHFGGPGALLGFVITAIFGPAANFVEVTMALAFRKQAPDGTIMGGPMQYLKAGISTHLAKWYAFTCLLMMIAWSSAQANQLASVMSMPLLGEWKISPFVTASCLGIGVLWILLGGIKRISDLNAKLVPLMFVLYVGGAGWIIIDNIEKLPTVLELIISSAFTPQAFGSGVVVGGIAQALRWGVFKGIHSCEAGIGTQTIPHSMAETDLPANQGMLSMVATYSAACISILSGLVVLTTGTWNDESLPLGISMIVESFRMTYSHAGTALVLLSTLLFAFGTILGNSFNGGECFRFLITSRFLKAYYVFTVCGVFLGAIYDAGFIWTLTDFFLAPLAVPHILAILYLAFKRADLLEKKEAPKVALQYV